MIPARLVLDESAAPDAVLARARVVCASTTSERPVALYAAGFSQEALVLGAYQRPDDALSAQARSAGSCVVRASGGVTLQARPGVLYVALALHDRSTFMSCPKLRILNRNVRGALAGLRTLNVPAHYFGRDFISVDSRPGVFVGWSAETNGRVLLEMFVALRESYLPAPELIGYPAREHDPFRGKTLVTLAEAGVSADEHAVADAIARGYASMFHAEWHAEPLASEERERAAQLGTERAAAADTAADSNNARLSWSAPIEEAIGFVSAGVAFDASAKIAHVRLAGDFFQSQGAAAALSRTLVGVTPTRELIGRSIDAVYVHGPHELEGVKALTTLQAAILDAAARAPT